MSSTIIPMFFIMLLARSGAGQDVLGPSWSAGLLSEIRRVNENIQGSVNVLNQRVQENVRDLNDRIREDVDRQLSRVDRLREEIGKDIGKTAGNVRYADQQGTTLIISNPGGTARSIYSGRTQDGQPYVRESEDRIVGNVLHHVDRVYDSTRRLINEYGYTLNLTDPKATAVPLRPVQR